MKGNRDQSLAHVGQRIKAEMVPPSVQLQGSKPYRKNEAQSSLHAPLPPPCGDRHEIVWCSEVWKSDAIISLIA